MYKNFINFQALIFISLLNSCSVAGILVGSNHTKGLNQGNFDRVVPTGDFDNPIPMDVIELLFRDSTTYGFYGNNKYPKFVEYLGNQGEAELVNIYHNGKISKKGVWSKRGNTFCFSYGYSNHRNCGKYYLSDLGVVFVNIATKEFSVITKVENESERYSFDFEKGHSLTKSDIVEFKNALSVSKKTKKNLLPNCINNLKVKSVGASGAIIGLSDSSVWEISKSFRSLTNLWLPGMMVKSCDGKKLFSLKDDYEVEALRRY